MTATFKEELESEYAGLAAMSEVGKLYLNDGMPYEVGDTLTNPDLATALQAIADGGRDAFYTATWPRPWWTRCRPRAAC